MIYKPRNKQELLAMIGTIIQNTPEEFIDFDEVEFDLSSEFTVDGSDEDEWYKGCRTHLHPEGRIIIVIPVVRKASVYAYYADQLDKDIEEAERMVDDLKRMKEIYHDLGKSENS
jgi:hypothetical protein